MKIYLLLAIAALCVQASAQDRFATTPAPPAICKPCLFYGGDIDPNDPNADGFIDQNTILLPDSETLAAMTILEGDQVKVQGLLFNVLASSDDFDPITATWEIRSGVSENNGGTLISQGAAQRSLRPAVWRLAILKTRWPSQ